MAVGSLSSLSTNGWDHLFLEHVKPGLEKQFVLNTKVWDRFAPKTEILQGKYGVLKVSTAGAKSFGAQSSSTYPTADLGSYDEFHVYMKRAMMATLQFGGLELACAKGVGAVKDLVKTEIENLTDEMSNRLNMQTWGDGSGRLAQLYAAVTASTTGYVDGPTHGIDSNDFTSPSRYLQEGMYVDIYNTSGTLQGSNVKLSTITLGTSTYDTLTFADTVTADADAYLFSHGSYATSEAAGTGVPMGIKGMVTTANPYVGITATSAFQGVNRSSYTWAQGQVFNMGTSAAAPAAVTNKKILEVIQKVEQYGKVDVILTNGVIWRCIYSMWEADKTMPNEKSYWGGLTGLTFYGGKSNGVPIIYDDDCPDQSMYFLDSSKIYKVAPDKSGLEWVPGTSGHILTRVQGKDEFTANLRSYYNLATDKPRAHGLLRYIKHADS